MLYTILRSLIAGFQTRQSLVLEILALRHQVQVLKRGGKRPKLKKRDRALWVLLSRFWRDWRFSILMVKPDTVIRWHRAGFRTYWRFKSRTRRRGRPRLTMEERELIRQMARDNPCPYRLLHPAAEIELTAAIEVRGVTTLEDLLQAATLR